MQKTTYTKGTNLKRTLLLGCLALAATVTGMHAQNNTNSPYTRYGYGALSDMGASNSRAMGGIGYGLRDKYHTNYLNPASYTAIDSLTFKFEGGVTLQNTNFDDGTLRQNAKNTSFDYLTMHFRLGKTLAMSLGLLPYSNVGYDVTSIDTDKESTTDYTSTNYYGSGGLHQAYVGLGYKIFRGLSVGLNFSYLWGDVSHTLSQGFPYNSSAMVFTRIDEVSVKSYKMDLGVQYTRQLGKKHFATVGAVFSPGHDLNNSAYINETLGNETLGYTQNMCDTAAVYSIPTTIGVGATYTYDDRLTVGLDGTYQRWSKARFMDNGDAFADRLKVAAGAEYIPNRQGASFVQRTRYRFGAYWSKPYYKVEGKRAADEYGVTGGFGIPLVGGRSMLNVSAQYVRVSGKTASFLNENTLRVNIGVTFNERWFYKYKVN